MNFIQVKWKEYYIKGFNNETHIIYAKNYVIAP